MEKSQSDENINSKNSNILWSFVSNFIGLFYRTDVSTELQKNYDPEKLLEDWEWVLSPSEEMSQKQAAKNTASVNNDLKKMRRITRNIKLRPRILQYTQTYYSVLNQKILSVLLSSRLDSNKRDSVIRQAIDEIQANWLVTLSQIIYKSCINRYLSTSVHNMYTDIIDAQSLIKNLKNRWHHSKYEKDICGEISDFAFQSSTLSSERGLNYQIIGDILWSIYLYLSRELSSMLNRGLYQIESDILLNSVLDTTNILVKLWYEATIRIGNISERQGKLTSKWNNEDQERKAYLESLKLKGVDAKFTDGPTDDLWRKHYFKHMHSLVDNTSVDDSRFHLIDHNDLLSRRKSLHSLLVSQIRIITNNNSSPKRSSISSSTTHSASTHSTSTHSASTPQPSIPLTTLISSSSNIPTPPPPPPLYKLTPLSIDINTFVNLCDDDWDHVNN